MRWLLGRRNLSGRHAVLPPLLPWQDDANAKALEALPQCRNDGGLESCALSRSAGLPPAGQWAAPVAAPAVKPSPTRLVRASVKPHLPHAVGTPLSPPPPAADQFQLLRQQLFANSDFWPCGPYSFDDEEWAQQGGEGGDDGWVHYDTSNWRPPVAAAAGGAAAPPAAGSSGQ